MYMYSSIQAAQGIDSKLERVSLGDKVRMVERGEMRDEILLCFLTYIMTYNLCIWEFMNKVGPCQKAKVLDPRKSWSVA